MSQIVQIPESTSIALHSVALIAGMEGRAVSAQAIADATGASIHHIAKVIQRLIKGGILVSVHGPKGGARLARCAKDITLLDVYEAMEGSYSEKPCHKAVCAFRSCIFGTVVDDANAELRSYFQTTTMESISRLVKGGTA